jgi:hypothetical protein
MKISDDLADSLKISPIFIFGFFALDNVYNLEI